MNGVTQVLVRNAFRVNNKKICKTTKAKVLTQNTGKFYEHYKPVT